MFRSVRMCLWVLAVDVSLAAASDPHVFYEKTDSLQQTMLITRARVQQQHGTLPAGEKLL